jgi:hypothetical protein
MHEEINKPIFVVGSPRSGTSILAWCPGHHPTLFSVLESNWMGQFAEMSLLPTKLVQHAVITRSSVRWTFSNNNYSPPWTEHQ